MVIKGILIVLFFFIPWLLNFSDLPNYGLNSSKRYTLRLLPKCLVRSTLLPIEVNLPQPFDTLFDSLRWVPFSLALHFCSSWVITKWCKIYTKTDSWKNVLKENNKKKILNHKFVVFLIYMRNLDNFRQAVQSQKSWNSMGYICPKTTFLQLKHYIQKIILHYFQLLVWKFTKFIKIPYVIFHDTTRLFYFSSNITYFWQKYLIKV